MPAQSVTASAACYDGETYDITTTFSSMGYVLPNPTIAPAGATVKLQAKPYAGYHTEWVGSQGVTLTNTTGDTTTFTMLNHAVSIEVRYVRDN